VANGFFSATTVSDQSKPASDQGVKLSLKNSLAVFLVTWLTVELIGELNPGLVFGLSFGLSFGLIAGLNRGGSAVIKHYALRLTLWINGYTPLNSIKFLDHCAKLILLKKVGGGLWRLHLHPPDATRIFRRP
jgi:hypothetical protein